MTSEELLKNKYPLVEGEFISGRLMTVSVPGEDDAEWAEFSRDPDKWVHDIIRLHGFAVNGYGGRLKAELRHREEQGVVGAIGPRYVHIEVPARLHSRWIEVMLPIDFP